jgi:hypothetical protein
MGFWHTGYAEFHEEVGLGDIQVTDTPAPRYCCDQCDAVFDSLEKLRTHRFEAHPIERPCLLIRGVEVNTQPLVIKTPLSPSDITVLSTQNAILNDRAISASSLGEALSRYREGTARIVLLGDIAKTPKTIHFMVATPDDLEGVERCFLVTASEGRLDRRAIEHFITSSKRFRTAEAYCGGICEYLYGVLAKERSRAIDVPYDQYRDKLNRAVDALNGIQRPLARHISGLVDFNFNLLQSDECRASSSRVAAASARLRAWGDGRIAPVVRPTAQRTAVDRALTDADTESIIAWMCQDMEALTQHVDEIEEFSHKPLAEFDKTKCHIILGAIHYQCGNVGYARNHARELYHLDSPQLSARGLLEVIERG